MRCSAPQVVVIKEPQKENGARIFRRKCRWWLVQLLGWLALSAIKVGEHCSAILWVNLSTVYQRFFLSSDSARDIECQAVLSAISSWTFSSDAISDFISDFSSRSISDYKSMVFIRDFTPETYKYLSAILSCISDFFFRLWDGNHSGQDKREALGRGGMYPLLMNGRSRIPLDPRIPTMSGRSMSGFHRPGRHCLHWGGGGWGACATITVNRFFFLLPLTFGAQDMSFLAHKTDLRPMRQ